MHARLGHGRIQVECVVEGQLLDRRGHAPAPRLYLQDPRALDDVELPVPPLPWEVLRGADLPERDPARLLCARLPEPRLDVSNLVGVVPDQVLERLPDRASREPQRVWAVVRQGSEEN